MTDFYWRTLFAPGVEHLRLEETADGVIAEGVLTVHEAGGSFRVRYRVEADAESRTRRVRARSTAGAAIDVLADGAGRWTRSDGVALPGLDGAIDVDIAACAYTNTLTIRRLALAPGASATETIAYVRVPSLAVAPVAQRYTCLARDPSGRRWRYENLTDPSTYEIAVDRRGIVREYPGIFERLWPDGVATALGVGAIVERDGSVLLLRRSPDKDHAPGEWEPVSGRVEADESPHETVVREVREETGLGVEVVAPVDTFHFLRGAGRVPHVGIAFHCRVVGGSLAISPEHDDARWVPRDRLRGLPDLTDGVRTGLSRWLAVSE